MFGMGAGGMPVGSGHGFAIGSLSWCGGSTLSYASGDVHAALWCKSVSMVLVGPSDFIGILFFEELSVPYGYPACAINFNNILVKQADLYNSSRLVLLERMWASLVWDTYMITNDQWWKALGVLRPAFC